MFVVRVFEAGCRGALGVVPGAFTGPNGDPVSLSLAVTWGQVGPSHGDFTSSPGRHCLCSPPLDSLSAGGGVSSFGEGVQMPHVKPL